MSPRVVVVGLVLGCSALPALGQNAETILNHDERVYAVAFSPDGKLIAAGGERGELILWEASTGKRLARLAGHEAAVTRVAFASGGKVLAASTRDHLILWEVPGGKVQSRTPGVHFLGKHGVASFDVQLASGQLNDGLIQRWDFDRKAPPRIWRTPKGAGWPTLSADGEQLAVLALADTWNVVILDLATMTERISFPLPDLGEMYSVAMSPDNRIVAIGSGGGATLWDIRSGKLHSVLAWHAEGDGEADT